MHEYLAKIITSKRSCMQRYKDVRELRSIFEEYGPLADVNVPINQMNNQPRGFAFVEYKRSASADE